MTEVRIKDLKHGVELLQLRAGDLGARKARIRRIRDAALALLEDRASSPYRWQLRQTLSRLEDEERIANAETRELEAAIADAQRVCSHPETVFDHECYHKRIDYSRCTTCGKVI